MSTTCAMYALQPLHQRKLRMLALPREIRGSREMVYLQCHEHDLPEAVVATGSFGCVCPYTIDGTKLAVKWFYHRSSGKDVFEHELRVATAIAHTDSERIARMLDFSRPSRWIAFEWLPNGELFSYINRRALPEHIALYYLRQLLEALDGLHSMDIYHLDVKTDNLMLDQNYQVKLVDFSCCFLQDGELDETSEAAVKNRAKELLMPFMHHAPPEFRLPSCHARFMDLPAAEKLAVFEKADVWSAGMAALTMLAGCYCFSEPGAVDANRRTFAALILRDDRKFWHHVGELVTLHKRSFRPSEGMKELLTEMLCANHHERPTAAELLERPILAPPLLPTAEEVATYMRQCRI